MATNVDFGEFQPEVPKGFNPDGSKKGQTDFDRRGSLVNRDPHFRWQGDRIDQHDAKLAAAHERNRKHNEGDHSLCLPTTCKIKADEEAAFAAQQEVTRLHSFGNHSRCLPSACKAKADQEESRRADLARRGW